MEVNPDISQRQLAEELGVSLGKINFSQSQKKVCYVFVLTPVVIENKAALNIRFPKRKIAKYEALQVEIEKNGRVFGRAAQRDLITLGFMLSALFADNKLCSRKRYSPVMCS
jgi:hypothetical protein